MHLQRIYVLLLQHISVQENLHHIHLRHFRSCIRLVCLMLVESVLVWIDSRVELSLLLFESSASLSRVWFCASPCRGVEVTEFLNLSYGLCQTTPNRTSEVTKLCQNVQNWLNCTEINQNWEFDHIKPNWILFSVPFGHKYFDMNRIEVLSLPNRTEPKS